MMEQMEFLNNFKLKMFLTICDFLRKSDENLSVNCISDIENLYEEAVRSKEVTTSGLIGFSILYEYLYKLKIVSDPPKSIFSDLESHIYNKVSFGASKNISKENGIISILLYYYMKRNCLEDTDLEILSNLYIDELLIFLTDDIYQIIQNENVLLRKDLDDYFYTLLFLVTFKKEQLNNTVIEKSIERLFTILLNKRSTSDLFRLLFDYSVVIYQHENLKKDLNINDSTDSLLSEILSICLSKYEKSLIERMQIIDSFKYLDQPVLMIFLMILL
ncbi:hypothetical protein MUB18_04060 [Sphingobacterium sp. PCS056]|uniref:hypothetical protein n=1 Tax=Sphingobacterium sp. PCS056 TaxID=2931400 RepID=UPI00200C860F|nr:hypothetical protein [Sphingobacterium sp. PCS056]UPZ37486.1 hypothetical protein MUB18_04060 [Sphingobacterium sp. PCS056]